MSTAPRAPKIERRSIINGLITMVLVFVTFSFVYSLLFSTATPNTHSYSSFLADVSAGKVTQVQQQDVTLLITTTDNQQYQAVVASSFIDVYADMKAAALRGNQDPTKLQFEAKPPADNSWLPLIISTLLPILIIGGFLYFIFRQAQGTNNQALSFGRSKARMSIGTKTSVTFADVAGVDEAKQELEEVVEFLKFPEKFSSLGARIPRGVLLVGGPGTGKTLIARAVAGEAGVPFFSISGSEFVEMFVGVGASVSGDTPVLVRSERGTELIAVGEFVDRYYTGDTSDFVVPVEDVTTLGFEAHESGFRGHLTGFERSAWSGVRGVLRHKVDEIYEIEYLGGSLRTTGDHSVFVRGHGGIKVKMTRDLRPGDVLVDLPRSVRDAWDSITRKTTHQIRAHSFAGTNPGYLEVIPHNEPLEEALAFVMAQRGKMSQAAISMKIGVSQATVGNWQRGKHLPQGISPNFTDTVLPAQVAITPELLRLLGYYTAEGRVNGSVQLVFGSHETDLIADSAKIGENIFGVRAAITPTQDNSTRVTFGSAALGRLFERQCGNGSHNKHIPAMLWDLPREHFLAYLEGYMKGDGYTDSAGKMIATSVSHQLIRELSWLCAMHGIKTGSRQVVSPAGRIIKNKPLPETIAWSLIIGATSASAARPDAQGMPKRAIVRRVTRQPYEGYVYDLVGCENEAFFGGESPLLLHNSRVRDLFDQAKRNSPCIVFVDEIDAVGRQRGTGLGGSHDEREQTLNQILVEMDGFDTNTNVIVMAATNRPDILDPALLRPGRFDRRVVMDRPDIKGRLAILRVHAKGKPLDRAVDLEVIANQTPGFSGADLANLINEAAILAARHNRKVVTMPDFTEAIERIVAGPERKSRIISDVEKRIIAYHEGGHAVVQRLLPLCDPVSKVTIIGRGMALGYTMALPTEDRYLQSKAEFEDKIAGLMGGNAAEHLVFGDTTTGASNDIEMATGIARRMVTEFGMSSKLGPLAFGHKEELVFLGRDFGDQRNYSDDVARQIDEEIKLIIDRGYARATEVLKANRARLDALAAKLVVEETVDAAAFETLFADVPLKADPRLPVIPIKEAEPTLGAEPAPGTHPA